MIVKKQLNVPFESGGLNDSSWQAATAPETKSSELLVVVESVLKMTFAALFIVAAEHAISYLASKLGH